MGVIGGQPDDIDQVLEPEIAARGAGAAVAIFKDGRPVVSRGYGLANIEWGMPVAPETIFGLGSISKPLTALAIMMLVEDGRLALDTPIDAHLPPLRHATAPITVAHLLTHTSGVRSFNGTLDFVVRLGRQQISAADLLDHLVERPCDFAPGARWRYSNSGYALLAALIEERSGVSFGAFMRSRLFEPLGMTRTDLLHDNAILPRRAYDYQSGAHGTERARFVSLSWFRGSGSVASTIEDLGRLDAALAQGRIVSEASFARMLQPVRLPDGTTYPYGLGWGVTEYLGQPVHHHAGGLGGYCGEFCRLPAQGLAVVVLANHRDFPFHRIACRLTRIALGLPAPAEPSWRDAGPQERGRIVGVFVSPDSEAPLTLEASGDGRFRCSGAGVGTFGLAEDRDLHGVDDPEVALRLGRDGAGQVGAVTLQTPMFADQVFVRAGANR